MTVSMTTNKAIYIGNGSATSFAIPFSFLEREHLKVRQLLNGVLTERTDWTISGGNLVFTTAPAAGAQIAIMREVPLTQETDYRENEILPAETLERNFDKLTMQVQQLAEESGRSVKVDVFSDVSPAELVDEVEDIWAIKDDIVTDAQNASAIITAATNVSNINTVAGSIANVNTVAGDVANVNIVAGDKANIDTVATNISDVNTTAANMAAIQNAPTQAANAAASATLAQNWAAKTDGAVDGTNYSAKWYALNTDASGKANKDLSDLSATGNDKFVTKDTEQTITKHKIFTSAPSIKNTNLPSNSTIPASGENNVWVYANANDDSYIGGIGFSVTTTASRTLLFTRKNINGTNYSCYSANIIENDGTIYFNVPTPPATHNMNSAATTKWVNDHRCTTAATTASSASIYKPAIVIENYRNGNQWYRKWSDGWIEQGGYKSQATPNTITLNKAFTTTDYTILALCDRMDASAAPAVAAYRNNSNYPKSTTAFTLTGNTASLGQYWYACGY